MKIDILGYKLGSAIDRTLLQSWNRWEKIYKMIERSREYNKAKEAWMKLMQAEEKGMQTTEFKKTAQACAKYKEINMLDRRIEQNREKREQAREEWEQATEEYDQTAEHKEYQQAKENLYQAIKELDKKIKETEQAIQEKEEYGREEAFNSWKQRQGKWYHESRRI